MAAGWAHSDSGIAQCPNDNSDGYDDDDDDDEDNDEMQTPQQMHDFISAAPHCNVDNTNVCKCATSRRISAYFSWDVWAASWDVCQTLHD